MGMKRPEMNEAMVREAGRRWAREMAKWASAGDDFDDEEAVAEDLVKAFRPGITTFKLAERLDDQGWDISDEVLSELENFECVVDRILAEAVEKWITGCDVKPGFELGAVVAFKEGGKWGRPERRIEGMVTSIDMKRGTFTVSCPELGHWNTLTQGEPKGDVGGGVTYGRVLNWEEVEAA
jgi:hypothetical protein